MMDAVNAPISEAFAKLQADHAAKGRTAMFVAEGGKVIGLVTVTDPIKASAKAAIDALRR